MSNPDFNSILTTTLAKYRNTLVDNVFKDRPLLNFLSSKGRIRMIDGGESIVEQLIYAQNSTVASYSGYEPLDITPQEGLTAAVYPWRQLAASVAINGLEEAQNAGESRLIPLLKSKVMQAEESLKESLNEMLYADGTGNSGKDFLGLEALVDDAGIVGNINSATVGNEYWQSVVVDAAADTDTVRNDDEWTNAFYSASKGGGDAVDAMFTTQELFEHYESGLAPQLRFTSNDKADARFITLEFKGRPLYYDFYCPAGITYGINSKYMNLVGHRNVWFKNTPFKDAPDKDAKWSQILVYGNLTVSNRSRHFKVEGQTVA